MGLPLDIHKLRVHLQITSHSIYSCTNILQQKTRHATDTRNRCIDDTRRPSHTLRVSCFRSLPVPASPLECGHAAARGTVDACSRDAQWRCDCMQAGMHPKPLTPLFAPPAARPHCCL
eukprot:1194890-Prorocentrum_minimum.AAC.2